MFMQFNKGNIQSSIKISDMARGNICVPPFEEQRQIVSILKSIDGRIQNNNAINDNLAA